MSSKHAAPPTQNDVSVHFHPTTLSGIELGSLLPMAVWIPGTNLEALALSMQALPEDSRPARFCTFLTLVEESRASVLSALGKTRALVNDSRQRAEALFDLAVKSEALLRGVAAYLDHASALTADDGVHPSYVEWADGFEEQVRLGGVKGARCAISVVSSRSTRRLTMPRVMDVLGIALHNFLVVRMALMFHLHASSGAALELDTPWLNQFKHLFPTGRIDDDDEVDLTRPPLREDELRSYGLARTVCMLPSLSIQCWRLASFVRTWMLDSDRPLALCRSSDAARDVLEGTGLFLHETSAAAWVQHRDGLDPRMFNKQDWQLAAKMIELLGDLHACFGFGRDQAKLQVLLGTRGRAPDTEAELDANAALRSEIRGGGPDHNYNAGLPPASSNQPRTLGRALLASRLLRLIVAARAVSEVSLPCTTDLEVQAAAFAQDAKHLCQLAWFSVSLCATWLDRGHFDLVAAVIGADPGCLSLELISGIRDLLAVPPTSESRNAKKELSDLPRQHRHANLASEVPVAKLHAVIRRRQSRDSKLVDALKDADGLPASNAPRLLGERSYDSALPGMLEGSSSVQWQLLAELMHALSCRVNHTLMTWWKDLAEDILLTRASGISGWADRKDVEGHAKTAIERLETHVSGLRKNCIRTLDDPYYAMIREALLGINATDRYNWVRDADVGKQVAARFADAAVLSPASVIATALGAAAPNTPASTKGKTVPGKAGKAAPKRG